MAAVDLTNQGSGPAYSINGPNIAIIDAVLTTAQVASADEYLVAKFGENVSIPRGTIGNIVATYPALGASCATIVGIGDADGVIDDELIASGTTATAGGTDAGPAAPLGLLDVSGRYLILEIAVVGDAGGTVRIEIDTVGKPGSLQVP